MGAESTKKDEIQIFRKFNLATEYNHLTTDFAATGSLLLSTKIGHRMSIFGHRIHQTGHTFLRFGHRILELGGRF